MTPGARFGLVLAARRRTSSLLLVGDLVFGLQSVDGTYVDGGVLDRRLARRATSLFGMAAIHPTMAVVFDPKPIAVALLGPIRLVLLGVAMLVGPALLAIEPSGADSIVFVVAAATAVALGPRPRPPRGDGRPPRRRTSSAGRSSRSSSPTRRSTIP